MDEDQDDSANYFLSESSPGGEDDFANNLVPSPQQHGSDTKRRRKRKRKGDEEDRRGGKGDEKGTPVARVRFPSIERPEGVGWQSDPETHAKKNKATTQNKSVLDRQIRESQNKLRKRERKFVQHIQEQKGNSLRDKRSVFSH
jgi:hypothetical protein